MSRGFSQKLSKQTKIPLEPRTQNIMSCVVKKKRRIFISGCGLDIEDKMAIHTVSVDRSIRYVFVHVPRLFYGNYKSMLMLIRHCFNIDLTSCTEWV